MIFRVRVRLKRPKKVVFVDRDGTLIEDEGYLSDPEEMKEINGSREALERLREDGCAIFLVSNQAGVAKGVIPLDKFHAVRKKFETVFDPDGNLFDGYFYCLHHAEGKIPHLRMRCRCRKPEPAMVETALSLLDVPPSPENIYVVGDKYSDVLLGKRVGGKSVLVLTGYGCEEKEIIEDPFGLPDFVAVNFAEAVQIITERD